MLLVDFTFLQGTVGCARLARSRDMGFDLVRVDPLDAREERP
jgi:hypothetical protein